MSRRHRIAIVIFSGAVLASAGGVAAAEAGGQSADHSQAANHKPTSSSEDSTSSSAAPVSAGTQSDPVADAAGHGNSLFAHCAAYFNGSTTGQNHKHHSAAFRALAELAHATLAQIGTQTADALVHTFCSTVTATHTESGDTESDGANSSQQGPPATSHAGGNGDGQGGGGNPHGATGGPGNSDFGRTHHT